MELNYKMNWRRFLENIRVSVFSRKEMFNENDQSNEKPLGVFNPNQRQFFEDELRYREKLEQLHAG